MIKLFSTAFALCIFLNSVMLNAAESSIEKIKGRVLVFSDVDDTIKISYVRDRVEMVSYSVFLDSLFYGMNTVYQALDWMNLDAEFHYVSNGWKPTVEQAHQAILSKFAFPDKQNYYTRSLKKIIHKYPHKFNVIVDVAKNQNPDTVVLVGDNGESDPKVYNEVATVLKNYFRSKNRSVEIHTFIHIVYKPIDSATSDLYPGQKPFANAADLAIQLAEIGLIKKRVAAKIAVDVVRQIRKEGKYRVYGPLVNPYFKHISRSEESIMCHSFYLR